MSARAFDRSYASHAAFYQDVYGHAVREVRPAGRMGAVMLMAEQDAGDWSDAPSPDLVVSQVLRHPPACTIDLGAGRFRAPATRHSNFICVAPGTPTSIMVDGPHVVRFAAVPYAALCALAGESSGLPGDGDFGRLHATTHHDGEVSGLLERLWAEGASGGVHGALWADGALLQLAAGLLRLRDGRDGTARGGLASWQVRRVCDYLEADLAADPGLVELATLVGLSTEHFCRAFKASTGLPPHAWLVARRVERARELLEATHLPVEEIAVQVGYVEPSHLARMFRRAHGTSPSQFRRDRRS